MSDGPRETARRSAVEQFLDNLRRSRLLTSDEVAVITTYSSQTGGATEANTLADGLVDQEVLTRWQADELLAGVRSFHLAEYRLLEQLGSGAMGSVYRALDSNKRVVALKVMTPELMTNPESASRFQREVRAMTSLDHPNLITAYKAESTAKATFLVMEYYPGRDLKYWLEQRGRFPIGQACECVVQAALGLQHAYENGMVHRDIKPANLLIALPNPGQAPVVKILDMGLARFLSESNQQRLTGAGQLIGTPDYVAPEQAKRPRDADTRSDIYALGCTLFELLTGEVPFPAVNMVKKLTDKINEDAPPIRRLRSEISEPLEEIVAKMLSRDPDQRFQTPAQVAFALAPFARDLPIRENE